MAYATPEQLAAALRLPLTPENTPTFDLALEAAAQEIDQALDRTTPLDDPAPQLVIEVNVARGVEWVKQPDAAFGGVGYADIGILKTPVDGFARHALTLIPYKQQWGLA